MEQIGVAGALTLPLKANSLTGSASRASQVVQTPYPYPDIRNPIGASYIRLTRNLPSLDFIMPGFRQCDKFIRLMSARICQPAFPVLSQHHIEQSQDRRVVSSLVTDVAAKD